MARLIQRLSAHERRSLFRGLEALQLVVAESSRGRASPRAGGKGRPA
jgi:hypothetical protein